MEHPKEYWIEHLKKLAAANAELKAENRKFKQRVEYLEQEEEYHANCVREQNATIITRFIEQGKEGNECD